MKTGRIGILSAVFMMVIPAAQGATYQLYNGDPYYYQNTFWIDPGEKAAPADSHGTPREFEDDFLSLPSTESRLTIKLFNQAYYSRHDPYNNVYEVATQGFLGLSVKLFRGDELVRAYDWTRPELRNNPDPKVSAGFDTFEMDFLDPTPGPNYRFLVTGITGNVGGQYMIEYHHSSLVPIPPSVVLSASGYGLLAAAGWFGRTRSGGTRSSPRRRPS